MLRALQILLIGILVDFYWFPFFPTIYPSINVKQLMALLGLAWCAFDLIRSKRLQLSHELLVCGGISLAYSVFNLLAIEINHKYDYSYANYIMTFFVWMFSAYACVRLIQWGHPGKMSIKLLTSYLSAICAVQSILAVLGDKVDEVKNMINSIAYNPGFYEEVNRLYGIGCALDSAGTRFSVVLLLIAGVVCTDDKVKSDTKSLSWFFLAFFIIASLGNMVSRTTTVGLGLASMYIVFSTKLYELKFSVSYLKVYRVLSSLLLLGVPLMIYLYNTDSFFYEQLRYGFEGFFNWVEQGEWMTASTAKLNNEMWVWPDTLRGWIIGNGDFALQNNYVSDIGYCRLILYSGIIGFSVFASLFLYNAQFFMRKYPRYVWMFFLLLALSFLIWIKVATDLFTIYALLLCFTDKGEARYGSQAHLCA